MEVRAPSWYTCFTQIGLEVKTVLLVMMSLHLGARVQGLNKWCSFCKSGIKAQSQHQLPSPTETLGVFISADF